MRIKQVLSGLIVACVILVSSGIATVVLREPSGSTSGSGSATVQYILNSNDNVYPMNESGLRDAVNNLNNLSGWVDGFLQTVTGIVASIRLGDECTLQNIRLVGDVAANVSILENYNIGSSTRNYNITVKNVFIDGNGETCDIWGEGSHEWYASYPHAVQFNNVTGLRFIDNLVTHSPGAGMFCHDIQKGWFTGNEFRYSGIQNEGSAVGNWNMLGLAVNPATDCIFDDNIFHNNYGAGFNLEAAFGATRTSYVSNCTVLGNIAYNNSDGFYFEHTDGIIVSNNFAHNNTKNECYPTAPSNGFTIGQDAHNIHLFNNHAHDNGNSDDGGNGISITNSHDITVIGGSLMGNWDCGVYVTDGAVDVTIQSVHIEDHPDQAIYIEGKRYKILDNTLVNNSVGFDIGAIVGATWAGGSVEEVDNCLIRGNTINNSGHGMVISSHNVTIAFNDIRTTTHDGIKVHGNRTKIIGNDIAFPGDEGIEVSGSPALAEQGLIKGNFVHAGGQFSTAISLIDAQNYTVVFNTITKVSALAQYPENGIVEGATGDYNYVMFNTVIGNYAADIDVDNTNSRINCTGFDDWNFYDGVS